MAVYQNLAATLSEDIRIGKLGAGQKMPSLRSLAKQHGVSMTTAVSCYDELVAQGWIFSKAKTGYFVRQLTSTHQTPTWESFDSHISQPPPRVTPMVAKPGPLGLSAMPMDDDTCISLEAASKRAFRDLSRGEQHYPNLKGEPTLRAALANHFSKQGLPLRSEELVITHGCISAVKTALETVTKAGDTVAVNSPCFNGLLDVLGELSLNILELPSQADGIDLTQLEKHLAAGSIDACLFSTSHMNPQGISMTPTQKQKLAALAKQYQTPIIEDDVYIELSHQGVLPLPTAYYDQEGYVLWCGSVSKSLTPALRLGWCAPGRYMQAYHTKFAASCLGVSLPTQQTIATLLNNDHYQKSLRRRQLQLLKQCHQYREFLLEHLPERATVSAPEGGLVLWIQVPDLDNALFIENVKAQHLDIRFGSAFSASSRYDNCIRVNFGFGFKVAAGDLLRLVKIIQRCC